MSDHRIEDDGRYYSFVIMHERSKFFEWLIKYDFFKSIF
jgi:hypothetical protein